MDTRDKIKKHQDILIQYLEEEGAIPSSNPNGGDYQVMQIPFATIINWLPLVGLAINITAQFCCISTFIQMAKYGSKPTGPTAW
jgi:hypothetical protein